MAPAPDLVFVNGPVFGADTVGATARAVAIGGGRIVAVGGEREVTGLVRPGTEVVDLAGRMLLPGFQDAHVHPQMGGLYLLRCDLLNVAGASDALRAIAAYAADHPEGWIRGGGWKYEWFEHGTPPAVELDRMTGDRPAYLRVSDGHSAWVNGAALRAAGIDASTPDPPDGRIERLADGSPQGTLHEGAMRLVERVMPPESAEDLERALLTGGRHLVELGITAWHDAWVGPELHEAYRSLAGRGELSGTARAALWWDRDRGREQIEELAVRRAEGAEGYRPEAVKLMLDGVCENFTASMLEPYLDGEGRPTDGHGIDMIDPGELLEIVRELDRFGFQCHFHAIGDAAVRHALDAVEAARIANGWWDARHTIAHLQVIHPDDLPRFRRLGVVANLQPLWAQVEPAMTELTIPFLGEPRAGRQYPFGSLRREGAVLAMGSDWPVSTADVMAQVHVAVRRTTPGDDRAPMFLPDERLDLPTALASFTAGSAFVNHLSADRGGVATGKVADLVVLDGDPFEAGSPADVRVEMTLVGGEVVFERRSRGG
jgi:predicted amidohydrolase YtcJ